MVRLDYLIFGYRKIILSKEDRQMLLSRLLSGGAYAMLSKDGNIMISERTYVKYKNIIDNVASGSVSETAGLLGYIIRVKNKSAIISAAFLSLVLGFILSQIVWDVRIDGNELYTDSSIRNALLDCGFGVGSLWLNTDKSDVENRLCIIYPEVSWVNINRRGSVAYVTVCEKEIRPDKEETPDYSNVIAESDCVIEEITVYSGTALVKVGDTVKAGDVLISGTVTTENGTLFCRAVGNVVGRLTATVEAPVGREYEKRVLVGEKISEMSLNIFNFSIEIFKNYGNPPKECDIIEEKNTLSLPGGLRLPIELHTRTYRIYENQPANYSDEQLVSVSSARLTSLIANELLRSDLISIKTSGGYTDTGYTMRAELVYLTEVGRELAIGIE